MLTTFFPCFRLKSSEENNTVIKEFEVIDSRTTDFELLQQNMSEHTLIKWAGGQIEVGHPDLVMSIGGTPPLCTGYDGQSNSAVNFEKKGDYYTVKLSNNAHWQ